MRMESRIPILKNSKMKNNKLINEKISHLNVDFWKLSHIIRIGGGMKHVDPIQLQKL